MRFRATGTCRRLVTVAIAGAALLASTMVVPGAGAGTGAPPTVTLDPTSVAPGSKVKVTAEFSEPCTTANAVLTSPYLYGPAALSGFFAVSVDGNGSSTITVPDDAWAGSGYTVTVACLDPPGPSSSAAALFVTGNTPQAAIQISPTEGPPGTAIDVALSITPAGVCQPNPPYPAAAAQLRLAVATVRDTLASAAETAGDLPVDSIESYTAARAAFVTSTLPELSAAVDVLDGSVDASELDEAFAAAPACAS